MKKIREIIAEYTEKLSASSSSAMLDTEVLISYVLGYKNKLDLIMNYDKVMEKKSYDEFMNLFEKRMKKMPIAYIINHKEFMGLDFYVDENVLIPRPDTELIVEELISKIDSINIENNSKICVMDMCTGSGAIVLSASKLSKNSSNTYFYGVDISTGALEVSKKNADNLEVSNVNFIKSDLFKSNDIQSLKGKLDIIVSNPPYIERSVIDTLDIDVKEFEPMIALSGGESGMDFYNKIIEEASIFLKKGGFIIFESGHNQADKISKKLSNSGFKDIYIKKDIQGFDRMICAKLY